MRGYYVTLHSTLSLGEGQQRPRPKPNTDKPSQGKPKLG